MSQPARGFTDSEFRDRVVRAQSLMADAGLAALLLTSEPDIRYFTGFLTRFWESPTRPWFLIVPATGDPVAVIPAIGAALMAGTWINDIRTWPAPDLADDGVSLLADTIKEICGAGGDIGLPMGHETHLRMPLSDFRRLETTLGSGSLRDDHGIMRRLRMIKSDAEIEKVRTACAIGDRAFARLGEIARPGEPIERVFRRFQMLCLEEGADWVPYLAGGAGPNGYADVISPASAKPLESGDVLMLDTGLVHDGYFCDFDRNFALGAPANVVADAHCRLVEAVDAAYSIARPGITAADLFHAMNGIVASKAGETDTGRLGHGLGMQLTEWPSLMAGDKTVIEAGMILTLEPGIVTGPDTMLVHEEVIVVRQDGAEFLTTPASGLTILGDTP